MFATVRRAGSLVTLACVLVSACKSNAPSSSNSAPGPVALAAPAEAKVIDVRPFTLAWRGQPIARLHDDGRTEAVGANPPGGAMSPGPTLVADGTIRLTKAGHTARLARDGKLYVAASGAAEQLYATIAEDHVVFVDGKNGVHVTGDLISFDDGKDDVGQIVGPVDAASRHTALVMFAAFMIEISLAQ
jgi:hypothetical protein